MSGSANNYAGQNGPEADNRPACSLSFMTFPPRTESPTNPAFIELCQYLIQERPGPIGISAYARLRIGTSPHHYTIFEFPLSREITPPRINNTPQIYCNSFSPANGSLHLLSFARVPPTTVFPANPTFIELSQFLDSTFRLRIGTLYIPNFSFNLPFNGRMTPPSLLLIDPNTPAPEPESQQPIFAQPLPSTGQVTQNNSDLSNSTLPLTHNSTAAQSNQPLNPQSSVHNQTNPTSSNDTNSSNDLNTNGQSNNSGRPALLDRESLLLSGLQQLHLHQTVTAQPYEPLGGDLRSISFQRISPAIEMPITPIRIELYQFPPYDPRLVGFHNYVHLRIITSTNHCITFNLQLTEEMIPMRTNLVHPLINNIPLPGPPGQPNSYLNLLSSVRLPPRRVIPPNPAFIELHQFTRCPKFCVCMGSAMFDLPLTGNVIPFVRITHLDPSNMPPPVMQLAQPITLQSLQPSLPMTTSQNNGMASTPNNGMTSTLNNGMASTLNNGMASTPNNGMASNLNNGMTSTLNNGMASTLNNGMASTPNNGMASTLNNGMASTPNNGMTSTLNNGMTSTLNNGMASTPNNGIASTPNNGMASTLNNGMASTPNNGMASTPNNGMASTPNNGMASTPNNGMASTQNNGMASTPNNGMASTLNNGMTSTLNNGMASTPNNGMASTPNNGMTSTPNNGMASTPNNGMTSTLNNGMASTLNNGITSTLNNGMTSTLNNGMTSTLNNGKASILINGMTSTPNNGMASTLNNGMTSTLNNGMASTLNNGMTSTPNNGMGSTPNNGMTSTLNNGMTSTLNNGMASTLNNGMASTPNNGMASTLNNGMASTLNNGMASTLNNGMASTPNNGMASILNNDNMTSTLNNMASNPHMSHFDCPSLQSHSRNSVVSLPPPSFFDYLRSVNERNSSTHAPLNDPHNDDEYRARVQHNRSVVLQSLIDNGTATTQKAFLECPSTRPDSPNYVLDLAPWFEELLSNSSLLPSNSIEAQSNEPQNSHESPSQIQNIISPAHFHNTSSLVQSHSNTSSLQSNTHQIHTSPTEHTNQHIDYDQLTESSESQSNSTSTYQNDDTTSSSLNNDTTPAHRVGFFERPSLQPNSQNSVFCRPPWVTEVITSFSPNRDPTNQSETSNQENVHMSSLASSSTHSTHSCPATSQDSSSGTCQTVNVLQTNQPTTMTRSHDSATTPDELTIRSRSNQDNETEHLFSSLTFEQTIHNIDIRYDSRGEVAHVSESTRGRNRHPDRRLTIWFYNPSRQTQSQDGSHHQCVPFSYFHQNNSHTNGLTQVQASNTDSNIMECILYRIPGTCSSYCTYRPTHDPSIGRIRYNQRLRWHSDSPAANPSCYLCDIDSDDMSRLQQRLYDLAMHIHEREIFNNEDNHDTLPTPLALQNEHPHQHLNDVRTPSWLVARQYPWVHAYRNIYVGGISYRPLTVVDMVYAVISNYLMSLSTRVPEENEYVAFIMAILDLIEIPERVTRQVTALCTFAREYMENNEFPPRQPRNDHVTLKSSLFRESPTYASIATPPSHSPEISPSAVTGQPYVDSCVKLNNALLRGRFARGRNRILHDYDPNTRERRIERAAEQEFLRQQQEQHQDNGQVRSHERELEERQEGQEQERYIKQEQQTSEEVQESSRQERDNVEDRQRQEDDSSTSEHWNESNINDSQHEIMIEAVEVPHNREMQEVDRSASSQYSGAESVGEYGQQRQQTIPGEQRAEQSGEQYRESYLLIQNGTNAVNLPNPQQQDQLFSSSQRPNPTQVSDGSHHNVVPELPSRRLTTVPEEDEDEWQLSEEMTHRVTLACDAYRTYLNLLQARRRNDLHLRTNGQAVTLPPSAGRSVSRHENGLSEQDQEDQSNGLAHRNMQSSEDDDAERHQPRPSCRGQQPKNEQLSSEHCRTLTGIEDSQNVYGASSQGQDTSESSNGVREVDDEDYDVDVEVSDREDSDSQL